MKGTIKKVFVLSAILIVSSAYSSAQEKKTQQHIKIVLEGKDGKEVVVDTIFNSIGKTDSIRLKNGKVIYFDGGEGFGTAIARAEGKEGKIFVTVRSGDSRDNTREESISIISGDSVKHTGTGGDGKIIIMKSGSHIAQGKDGDVMVWVSEGSGTTGKKVIYINEGAAVVREGEKIVDIKVGADKSGKTSGKMNYVLAKDGMVITIEGDDEEKIKEIADMIESKTGVKSDQKPVKQEVKEEVKKSVKK